MEQKNTSFYLLSYQVALEKYPMIPPIIAFASSRENNGLVITGLLYSIQGHIIVSISAPNKLSKLLR